MLSNKLVQPHLNPITSAFAIGIRNHLSHCFSTKIQKAILFSSFKYDGCKIEWLMVCLSNVCSKNNVMERYLLMNFSIGINKKYLDENCNYFFTTQTYRYVRIVNIWCIENILDFKPKCSFISWTSCTW